MSQDYSMFSHFDINASDFVIQRLLRKRHVNGKMSDFITKEVLGKKQAYNLV